MLNDLTSKIDNFRKPMPRPQPGMPVCHGGPKPAPGRQDDSIVGPGGRPKPRQPQPGDIYIGGPGPKGQKQYDAKDLVGHASKGNAPKPDAEIRAGGPFKLEEGFSLQKLLTK